MYLTGPAQGWGDNAVWFAFINATLPAVDNCAVGGVATCKAVNISGPGGPGRLVAGRCGIEMDPV